MLFLLIYWKKTQRHVFYFNFEKWIACVTSDRERKFQRNSKWQEEEDLRLRRRRRESVGQKEDKVTTNSPRWKSSTSPTIIYIHSYQFCDHQQIANQPIAFPFTIHPPIREWHEMTERSLSAWKTGFELSHEWRIGFERIRCVSPQWILLGNRESAWRWLRFYYRLDHSTMMLRMMMMRRQYQNIIKLWIKLIQESRW